MLLEGLLVADLACANPLVLYACEEIETNFCGGIAVDAALENGDDGVREVLWGARAVGDGGWLETVEFVKGIVYRGVPTRCVNKARRVREEAGLNVRDEVVDIIVFCGGTLGLVYEWGGSRE